MLAGDGRTSRPQYAGGDWPPGSEMLPPLMVRLIAILSLRTDLYATRMSFAFSEYLSHPGIAVSSLEQRGGMDDYTELGSARIR
jgi:hypothetical protein